MSELAPRGRSTQTRYPERIALVDLLDRVLAGGVVVTGEIRLAIADVDLVRVSLRVLITSMSGGFGEATRRSTGGP